MSTDPRLSDPIETPRLFRPLLPGTTPGDRILACMGAALGIAVAGILTIWFAPDAAALPLLVAPLGASAVLLFAVPASPLAQPWPAIGGNLLSGIVGVIVARWLGDGAIAGGIAVGLAIAVMSATRSLHPPGGAVALTMVVGGPAVSAAGFGFVAVPVGVNTALLVLAAWAFHGLMKRGYPHRAAPPPADGLLREDIDHAAEELGGSFDIAPDDLRALVARAEEHAARRRRG